MIYLHLLLLFLLVYTFLTITYSTWKTGISPMPSSGYSRKKMMELCPESPFICIDLGSGWGGMLLALSKEFPQAQIIGYECSWIPYLYSRLLCRKSNIQIYRKDFLSVSHPKEAVLFCYLCPKGMKNIASSLKGEAKWLVSHTFALPSHSPVMTYQLNDIYKSILYVYDISKTNE